MREIGIAVGLGLAYCLIAYGIPVLARELGRTHRARDITRRAIMRAQCSSRAEHFARRVK